MKKQIKNKIEEFKVPKIYIVNVGVNAKYKSKYGLISPIFKDGTFEFIPIKENSKISGDHILKYRDLKCYNSDDKLIKYFPNNKREELRDYYVHNDPEFETFTYGDMIDPKNPRSSNLQNIEKGDFLFFITSLSKYREGYFLRDSAAFYFIGYLEIDKLIIEEKDLLTKKDEISNNAHYRWYIDNLIKVGEFLIVKGSEKSKLFKYPFKITRIFCDSCLRDKDGKKFDWRLNQTENQIIGSYTRTVRGFINKEKDPELWNSFWKAINDNLF